MNVLIKYGKVVAIACPKRVTERFTEKVFAIDYQIYSNYDINDLR